MTRDQLPELHYITPIANLQSLHRVGVLSHQQAQRVEYHSVAMAEIQDRRRRVRIPGGRLLHEYANLYICARNPMMYRRRGQHRDLCVLRISSDVLDLPGVVVTDGNASSDYIRFGAGASGLGLVDYELTFAEYWTHDDPIEYYRRKCAKCAEVLVPDQVVPEFIAGAYVSCNESLLRVDDLGVGLAMSIDRHLFFQ